MYLKNILKACSNMSDGPWKKEPHFQEFMSNGHKCVMVRNPHSFNWCGYVGVKEGHPAYKKKYSEDMFDSLDVHGGLTFSDDFIAMLTPTKDPLWWLGFDCAHSDDLMPGYIGVGTGFLGGTYKDVEYVTNQLHYLSAQLKEMGK